MNDYLTFSQPQGFFDKIDPSFLNVYGLVRGSYNVLINDRGNVATRKGFALYAQEGSQTTGIKSAYLWETNTNTSIPIRTRYDAMQAYYDGQYRDVLTGLKSLYKMRFATWWDKTELKDRLLAVNGSTVIYHWTGGMTKIASWTGGGTNTVTKMYAKCASVGNTLTFDATAKTITQSTDTDFITLGFTVGATIRAIGTTNNNGVYTISAVTASVITVSSTDVLVNEVCNADTNIIGLLGKETWANERFASTGTKTINIAGTEFTYNAGWNKTTLTLTTDPSAVATAGGFVFQKVLSDTPSGGDFSSGLPLDRIISNLNQVYVGYSQGRNVFFSKQSDFKDYGYTVGVRKTGEGGTINLDNNLSTLAVDDDKVVITAGKSDIHRVTFTNFSDGATAGELYLAPKSKTSYGQSGASQESFVKIANGTLYLSNAPTIDFLGNVENIAQQQSLPLSDPIKRLLASLNRTDGSGVYTKNSAFFLFPYESVMLIYDVERKFWQPPQIISGSCLSLDESGNVLVHSMQTDESYTLFSGTNDNGAPISSKVFTNVQTLSKRSSRRTYDEIFIEIIVNGNANNVLCTMYSGYQGASGITNFTVGANDDSRFVEAPAIPSGWGTTPFGSTPFGSLFPDLDEDSEIGATKKLYEVQGTNEVEAFTQQFSVGTDEIDSYFELVSWGFNPKKATTSLVDIMKD